MNIIATNCFYIDFSQNINIFMFEILQGINPMGLSASLADYLKNNTSPAWKCFQHS